VVVGAIVVVVEIGKLVVVVVVDVVDVVALIGSTFGTMCAAVDTVASPCVPHPIRIASTVAQRILSVFGKT
jgi:hypothetical protein